MEHGKRGVPLADPLHPTSALQLTSLSLILKGGPLRWHHLNEKRYLIIIVAGHAM